MVAQYGMSKKLGPVEYERRYKELSSETRALIESEMQRTINEAQENVRQLLNEKRKELDLLAKALVEYETLDVSEVEKVIRGENLPGRTPVPKGPMVVPSKAGGIMSGGIPGTGLGGDDPGADSPSPPPPAPPPS